MELADLQHDAAMLLDVLAELKAAGIVERAFLSNSGQGDLFVTVVVGPPRTDERRRWVCNRISEALGNRTIPISVKFRVEEDSS